MTDMTPEGLRKKVRYEVKRMVLSGHNKDDGCVDDWTDVVVQLFSAFADEIIGSDSVYTKEEADGKCEDMSTNINSYMKDAKNGLRNEQRARKAHLIGKETV